MNINELRDRLNKLNSKQGSSGDLWKPKDEHQVRLLRAPDSDNPLREVYFHNDIGEEKPIPCPKMNDGLECKICEFADILKQWRDKDGNERPEAERKADFEIFKKIQAKARVYSPVAELNPADGEPLNDKAKWWSMTPAQAQQALEICFDGDRLEELGVAKDDAEGAMRILFDENKGYNINVSFAEPGKKGNTKTFTIVTLKGRIKPSALSKNPELIKKIMASIPKFESLVVKQTPEQVEKALAKFMNGGSAAEAKPTNGSEKPKYGGSEKPKADAKPAAAANTGEKAALSGTRSLDEAFGDLMADDKPKGK